MYWKWTIGLESSDNNTDYVARLEKRSVAYSCKIFVFLWTLLPSALRKLISMIQEMLYIVNWMNVYTGETQRCMV